MPAGDRSPYDLNHAPGWRTLRTYSGGAGSQPYTVQVQSTAATILNTEGNTGVSGVPIRWTTASPFVDYRYVNRNADRWVTDSTAAATDWAEYTDYNSPGTWVTIDSISSTPPERPMTPLELARKQNGNRAVLLDTWMAPLYKYLSANCAWGSQSEIALGAMMHQLCEALWHARQHVLRNDVEQITINLRDQQLGCGEMGYFMSADIVLATHCGNYISTLRTLADDLYRGHRETGQQISNKEETLLLWLNPALMNRNLKLEDKSVYSVFTKTYLTKTAMAAMSDEIPLPPKPKLRKLLRD